MSKLPTLLDLAAFSQMVEGEYVGGLTPQERQAAGAPDDWAAKDLVAHVTTWRERGAEDLKAILRGPLPPEPKEFDEVNRAIFDQNHGQTWEVVLGRVKKSWGAFTMALRDLTEDMLAGSGGEAQLDRPLWRRVTVDAGNHPVLHYAEFARRRGRGASATQWMEGLSPLLLAVDPAGEWHGVVHYNLACHYAQTGWPDKALDSLRAALELSPGLKEWSRQDSDLAPLHPDPRFSSVVDPEG
jgi:hypothetical protein